MKFLDLVKKNYKYKYCLCVKVNGKWKEIIYYDKKKRNELQYVNTYYREINSYGILTLKHFNMDKKYKIRNRLIKINYGI